MIIRVNTWNQRDKGNDGIGLEKKSVDYKYLTPMSGCRAVQIPVINNVVPKICALIGWFEGAHMTSDMTYAVVSAPPILNKTFWKIKTEADLVAKCYPGKVFQKKFKRLYGSSLANALLSPVNPNSIVLPMYKNPRHRQTKRGVYIYVSFPGRRHDFVQYWFDRN